jgi:hypothetical protein
MRIRNDLPEAETLAMNQSAGLLGIHEFSLLVRIQTGEVVAARLQSGEIAIPTGELERLLQQPINTATVPVSHPRWSDRQLGIERKFGGLVLKGDGPLDYTVPDSSARFTETEIQGYRAAFGAIAREVASIQDFKKQLNQPAAAAKKEICTSQLGVWQVRSTLLNTGPSQILLCQRQGKLAVIEKFPANTPYAVANSGAEILLQGNDAGQLEADFKAGARHTLEFMASNLTAKAQKIIWEQFPDHRPGRVIAAISERCATAVTEQETISETQKVTPSYGRGMRM